MSKAELPAHSPLGPSSAERWLNCPASVRATAGMPDTDSEYAIEGTAAHTLSEWCRRNDLPAKHFLADEEDHTIPVKRVDGGIEIVDIAQEMVESVQEFVDYVNAIPGDQLCETRVQYQKYVPSGFGTLDAAVMRPGYGTIIDLKYGKGVQKYAENNEQLMLYALGIYLDWDWLYQFLKFKLVVHQPRLDHVDEWEITVAGLLAWAAEVLVPGYLRTQDPRSAFHPGKVQCQFCKIRATCKARAESVFAAAVGEFDDLDAAMVAPVKSEATLTNDQIAKALDAMPNIKSWLKAIEAHAVHEIMHGRTVGSYKMVEGRSKRAWAVPTADVVKAFEKEKLDTAQLYLPPEIITMPAAEKLVGKKLFAPSTDDKPGGALAALVKNSPGKPALVIGSDKRPALAVDALAQFTDLTTEE